MIRILKKGVCETLVENLLRKKKFIKSYRKRKQAAKKKKKKKGACLRKRDCGRAEGVGELKKRSIYLILRTAPWSTTRINGEKSWLHDLFKIVRIVTGGKKRGRRDLVSVGRIDVHGDFCGRASGGQKPKKRGGETKSIEGTARVNKKSTAHLLVARTNRAGRGYLFATLCELFLPSLFGFLPPR